MRLGTKIGSGLKGVGCFGLGEKEEEEEDWLSVEEGGSFGCSPLWILSLSLEDKKGDQGGVELRFLSGLDRGVKHAVEFKLPLAGAAAGNSEDNRGDGH